MKSIFGFLNKKPQMSELGRRAILEKCEGVWGASEVTSSPPSFDVYRDVRLMPCRPHVGLHVDPGWGVYDSAGALIEAAALRIGAGVGLVGQSPHISLPASGEMVSLPEGKYIYGGSINRHYGHFVCSSLSRLWWMIEKNIGDQKILFHSPTEIEADWRVEFIKTCFNRVGLSGSSLVLINAPSRVEEITIPGPAFVEQTVVHTAYRQLCHAIGSPDWMAGDVKFGSLPPAYLSKTKLPISVGRVANEQIIEDIMSSRGVEIIYPETLNFSEQINLFSQPRVIVGVVGSAFHTAIFAPPRCKMLCLAPRNHVNSNMILMDKVNDARTSYYSSRAGFAPAECDDRFGVSINLHEPELVAQELADVAFEMGRP